MTRLNALGFICCAIGRSDWPQHAFSGRAIARRLSVDLNYVHQSLGLDVFSRHGWHFPDLRINCDYLWPLASDEQSR
jgi:hypothetical protein